MLIKRPADIKYSEVTAENLYHNRREFLRTATATLGVAAAGTILPGCVNAASSEPAQAKPKGPYDTTEKLRFYQTIPTLRTYVIASHRERRITVLARDNDGAWSTRTAISGGRLTIESLGTELIIDEIYRKSSIS